MNPTMLTTPRTAPRLAALGVAALLAVGALSGCSAGLHAITSAEIGATEGINGSVGTVLLRNALIRSSGSGATIEFTLINTGADPDTLLKVSTPTSGSVTFSTGGVSAATLTVPPTAADGTQHPLAVNGSGTAITLADVHTQPAVGTLQPVTLSFAKAGEVTLALPVVAAAK